jgi:hypothetical protein
VFPLLVRTTSTASVGHGPILRTRRHTSWSTSDLSGQIYLSWVVGSGLTVFYTSVHTLPSVSDTPVCVASLQSGARSRS